MHNDTDRIISSTSHRREQLVPGPPAMRPINPRKSKMGLASKLSSYCPIILHRVKLNLFLFFFSSSFCSNDLATAKMANEDACRELKWSPEWTERRSSFSLATPRIEGNHGNCGNSR